MENTLTRREMGTRRIEIGQGGGDVGKERRKEELQDKRMRGKG